MIDYGNLSVSKEQVNDEVQRLIERTPNSEKEIRKFYKKPSNRKRLEDDMMEKGYLDGLNNVEPQYPDNQYYMVNYEDGKLDAR